MCKQYPDARRDEETSSTALKSDEAINYQIKEDSSSVTGCWLLIFLMDSWLESCKGMFNTTAIAYIA